MKISENGISLITKFEGFSAKPYICPANYLTIGYGHVILDDDLYMGAVLTKADALELLKKDCVRFEKAVLRLISVPLSQSQFDALVSFAFNLGAGALQRSALRMKLNRGEYFDASLEFLKWVRGGGKVLSGLVRRRKAERELFLRA